MWWLVKTAFSFALFGALAYGFFFVDLQGKSFAGHLLDVWRSPTVQQKVGLVENNFTDEVTKKIKEQAAKQLQNSRGESVSAVETISDADRQALLNILEPKEKGK